MNIIKNILRLLILVISLIYCVSEAEAGDKNGTSSGSFLKISLIPRAASLGNSFAALNLGSSSLVYNPAGIFTDKLMDISVAHTDWFAGIDVNYLGVVHNSTFGSIGLSAIALSTGDMEITTPEQFQGTGEYFRASEFAFGAVYAKKISEKLIVGGSVKILKSYLFNDGYSASAFALDMGTLYKVSESLTFGVTLKDLGTDLKYISESFNLPTSISAGVTGTEFITENQQILWVLQGSKYSDSDEIYSMGIEYSYNNLLFIRSGYKHNSGNKFSMNNENFSFGAGFNFRISGYDIKTDYSYTNYKWLTGVHRISLQTGF